MALNLWKVGGQPTSFNPLPSGYNAFINLRSIFPFVVKFKAKSNSGARLLLQWDDGSIFLKAMNLTSQLTEYSFEYMPNKSATILFIDEASKGDIIIDSIELVQKPLPKLTLNGVDGFLSGKWQIGNGGVLSVIDDETIKITTTANYQYGKILVPVQPNQNIVLSFDSFDGRVSVYNDAISVQIVPYTSSKQISFNTGSNTSIQVIMGSGDTLGAGTFTFKRPMLNLGSTPVPYEKKRGDNMVLPVAKKNLLPSFDSWTFGGNVSYDKISPYEINKKNTGTTLSDSITYTLPVVLGKRYTFSIEKSDRIVIYNGDSTVDPIIFIDSVLKQFSFTVDSSFTKGKIFIRFDGNPSLIKNVQLEEGTIATPYTPYAVQVNKKPQHALVKSRTGLSFNGVTDYLQLPSMTMDSVEVECLIDSVQPSAGFVLLDARTGLNNGFVASDIGGGIGSGWSNLLLNGNLVSKTLSSVSNNQRVKLKFNASSVFTDDIAVFARYVSNAGSQNNTKGILYKVTCYLNGSVVAQYDFENPRSLVGTSVLQNAVNLIPSFEDARWSIHANAKVLGKDVLHLDASGNFQSSNFKIPCNPNTIYTLNAFQIGGRINIWEYIDTTSNGIVKQLNSNLTNWTFTTKYNTNNILIEITNDTLGVGSFDFYRPQLYALDGTEGTINGAPTNGSKHANRSLYSKR